VPLLILLNSKQIVHCRADSALTGEEKSAVFVNGGVATRLEEGKSGGGLIVP
jgi:hypothetical protein